MWYIFGYSRRTYRVARIRGTHTFMESFSTGPTLAFLHGVASVVRVHGLD
jgi:hypothetical protein